MQSAYFANSSVLDPIADTQVNPSEIWLFASAWGWNSNHRSGHLTASQVTEPHHVQRSKTRNYVSCSAGKHHSLLISDRGIVYTFGDGRKGQLGYGNLFTGMALKGGIVQSTPASVTPTGNLKFGRDIQCVEVGGGGSFSVAREASVEEGSKRVVGFVPLEEKMQELIKYYGESSALRKAWSVVRQERCAINRISEGVLITWGSGERGELGLGKDTKSTPFPLVNTKLRDISITKIAVGERHVLAVDSHGRLFSWGCGTSGRLGHGDFEDRLVPEVVRFFAAMVVTHVAAGDAHSAVMTIGRNVPGEQFHKVLTFGRGAHGRLGNGTNKNQPTPALVRDFPDSFTNIEASSRMYMQAIACGGAHTMLLCYTHVQKGLAFPYGIQTFIYSWGFGANGQLGTGERNHSFLPVKTRMPKAAVIVEIAAGRSWSLARTFGGTLFSWGKGLRGQLGQGDRVGFSLAPRQIETHASYLKLAAQYAHTLGVCVQKKYFNDTLLEEKYRALEKQLCAERNQLLKDGADPSEVAAMKHEMHNIFTYHERFLSLAPLRSRALYEVNCCKRNAFLSTNSVANMMLTYRESIRYHCLTCNVDYVCYSCSMTCHAGHVLVLSTIAGEMKKRRMDAHQSSAAVPEANQADQVVVGKSNDVKAGSNASATLGNGSSRSNKSTLRSSISMPSTPPTSSKGGAPPPPGAMRLTRTQSIIAQRSKNPLELIIMKLDTLKYDDELPPSMLHHIVTALGAGTFMANVHHNLKNSPYASLTPSASLAASSQYLEKGTILFPRRIKAKLPINTRNKYINKSSEDMGSSSTEYQLYDRRTGRVAFQTLLALVHTKPRVAYNIKFMERYPQQLPYYQTLVSNIMNRIVKKDKDRMKLQKRSSFDMTNEAYANAMASASESKAAASASASAAAKKRQKKKVSSSNNSSSNSLTSSQRGGSSISKFGGGGYGGTGSGWSDGAVGGGAFPMIQYMHAVTNSLRKLVPACHCALYCSSCKLLPNIPEASVEEQRASLPPTSIPNHLRYYYPSKHLVQRQGIYREDQKISTKHEHILQFYTVYAMKIQALVRRYVSKCRFLKLQLTLAASRRQVVREHVEKNILNVVWRKLDRVYAQYREGEERKEMHFEDMLMDKYNRYKKLQRTVMAVKVMLLGTKHLLAKASIHYPVRVMTQLPDKASVMAHSAAKMTATAGAIAGAGGGRSGEESATLLTLYSMPAHLPEVSSLTSLADVRAVAKQLKATVMISGSSGMLTSANELLLPSYAYSWTSVRTQQLLLHPRDRLPAEVLALVCRHYPIYDHREGRYFDLDICDNFYRPFVQSKELLYAKIAKVEKAIAGIRRVAERADAALKALKKAQQLQQARGPSSLAARAGAGGGALGGGGGGFAPQPPALTFNQRLLGGKSHTPVRVKTQHVRAYAEQLAIYRKVLTHNLNNQLGNILNLYAHPSATALTCLDILKHVPFVTLFEASAHYTDHLDHVVQSMNQVYYRYLHELQLQKEQLEVAAAQAEAEEKAAKLAAEAKKNARKTGGLMARYSINKGPPSRSGAGGGSRPSTSSGAPGGAGTTSTASGSTLVPAVRPATGTGATAGMAPVTVASRPGTSTGTGAGAGAGAGAAAPGGGKEVPTLVVPAPGAAAHAAVTSALQDPSRPLPTTQLTTLTRSRRHSIGDPARCYSRLQQGIPLLQIRAQLKRRHSEPINLKLLHCLPVRTDPDHRANIRRSLELFTLRLSVLRDLQVEYTRYFSQQANVALDTIFAQASVKMGAVAATAAGGGAASAAAASVAGTARAKGHYLWVMYGKTVRSFAPFSPRLPRDINTLLTEPSRRRTLAAPERLYPQLIAMYSQREQFATIVNATSQNYEVRRHKRSFDLGEILDEEAGLLDEMDFGFDEYIPTARLLSGQMFAEPFETLQAPREAWADYGFGGQDGQSRALSPSGGASPSRLTPHQRRVKADKTRFRADCLHVEQRMVVMRYTEASEEIVQLTREHLAEKKKLDTLKKAAAGTADPRLAELLSEKLSESASGKTSVSSRDKAGGAGGDKKRKRRATRQGVTRSSVTSSLSDGDDHSALSGSISEKKGGWKSALSVVRESHGEAYGEDLGEDLGDGWGDSFGDDGSRVEVWQMFLTSEGQEYYYHPDSGETSWSLPEEANYYDPAGQLVSVQVESQYTDEQGHAVWYNHTTQESRYA